MVPRAYRATKRAASAEETRTRVVEATVALHTEKGVAATSWQDIADRAGVAVGTVYFHFPTIDDLIPACTGMGRAMIPPPTAEIFRGVRGRRKRIGVLVRETFKAYEPMAGVLTFMTVERKTIPAVDRVAREMSASQRELIRDALGGDHTEHAVSAIEALVDFRIWESMHERGLTLDEIVELVSGTILTHLKNSR